MPASIFFFTKTEEKTFSVLSEDFQSVTCIASRAHIPRTSASKALKRLESFGLVKGKKVYLKNQHVYAKASKKEIFDIITLIKKKLVKDDHESITLSTELGHTVTLYQGKEAITSRLIAMMSQEKGERIYTMQASGTTKEWITCLGEEAVLEIHKLFKERGLIVVGVQGETYAGHLKKYTNKMMNSFRNRLDDIHIIHDSFLEQKTAMYIYRSTILFVDIAHVTLFEIHSPVFSKVLKKAITFIAENSTRVRSAY